MITLKYHLVDSKLRKQVDLRVYKKELENVINHFHVRLDKVKRDYYEITILTDIEKNKIVRKLGRQIANKTSLKLFCRKKSGANNSYELFKQKKS